MVPTDIASAFLPNRVLSRRSIALIAAAQALLLLVLWHNAPPVVFPRPGEVISALGELWIVHGLGHELWVSMSTSLQAIVLSAVLGLAFSYGTVVPALRPGAGLVSMGRFLILVGLTFTFTLAVGGGHPLKLALLTFGMLVFFVTSMPAVVAGIFRDRFDYARALGMSQKRAVFEVVLLGTADEALEILRQNAAIRWTLLTMVEGCVRSDGGAGALLMNQTKQDYLLGTFRRMICPYAELRLERR